MLSKQHIKFKKNDWLNVNDNMQYTSSETDGEWSELEKVPCNI